MVYLFWSPMETINFYDIARCTFFMNFKSIRIIVLIFSSSSPKGHMSYCHHLASIIIILEIKPFHVESIIWQNTTRWFHCKSCMNDHSYITEFEPCTWQGVLDIALCEKVCQWLATGRWFSPGTPVSYTNKTDCHDIIEILLKCIKHHKPKP